MGLVAISLLLVVSPIAVSGFSTHTIQNGNIAAAFSRAAGAQTHPESGVKTLCSSLPNGDEASSVYHGKGGAFVEDWSTGNLVWCSKGTAKTIATAPSGGANDGYLGMGGVVTKTKGTVLVLTSWGAKGMWFCYGATSSGCKTQSSFIAFPSSFCSAEPVAYCDPVNAALDKSLNVYFADANNAKLVECTASSNYAKCTNLAASSALTGYAPWGLALVGKTVYIADSSCSGLVWKGTTSSLKVITSVSDSLEGIAVSKHNAGKVAELYVGDTGFCTSSVAHIVDLTDSGTLPTPFSGASAITSIDSALQFGSYTTAAAYQTSDPS